MKAFRRILVFDQTVVNEIIIRYLPIVRINLPKFRQKCAMLIVVLFFHVTSTVIITTLCIYESLCAHIPHIVMIYRQFYGVCIISICDMRIVGICFIQYF